jgi:protein SCO1/2
MAYAIQKIQRSILGTLVLLSVWLCQSTPIGAETDARKTASEVTEKLGATIPLDLLFRDESGAPVRLADLMTGPTIILPVYYSCTNVCAYQLGRMAGTLQNLDRQPIVDYRVIAVSFDETDTPEIATRSKRTYLTAMRKPFPQEGWRFLTGNADSIKRLTDSIGYGFQRKGKDFIHPVASVVISGDGKIIRYLYGIAVLPKDLALAIAEAKSGVAGASVRKMMEYCFTFDPIGKTYVFNLLRVSATVVILCAGSLLAFLIFGGKRKENKS